METPAALPDSQVQHWCHPWAQWSLEILRKFILWFLARGNFLCNRVPTNFDVTSDCILLMFIGHSTALLDLTGLDTSPSAQYFSEFPETPSSQELGISLLDDELMSLGKKSVMTLCHVILLILYELWIGAYEGLHKTLECMTHKY